MPTRYMLDTNVASYVIKGKHPGIRERLRQVHISLLCISVVTEAELRFGAARTQLSPRISLALDEFFVRVEIFAWDSSAAKCYAELRTVLERSGTPMGNADLMIAAHALALDAVLVTHDDVFSRVARLKYEDWVV